MNKSTNTELENSNILKIQKLRELETKLKKKEHELQLREKTLKDNSKEVNKLNSYIKKIENEKLEYERTIQTLSNKLEQMSQQKTTTTINNNLKPECQDCPNQRS